MLERNIKAHGVNPQPTACSASWAFPPILKENILLPLMINQWL